MFALGEKTVNQRKHKIVCTHVVHWQTICILPPHCIVEVQILEVNSLGLCGSQKGAI